LPIKHQGQTTSETTSMTGCCIPAEVAAIPRILRDSKSRLMTNIRSPSEYGHTDATAFAAGLKSESPSWEVHRPRYVLAGRLACLALERKVLSLVPYQH
jgi:hypothetical protein